MFIDFRIYTICSYLCLPHANLRRHTPGLTVMHGNLNGQFDDWKRTFKMMLVMVTQTGARMSLHWPII